MADEQPPPPTPSPGSTSSTEVPCIRGDISLQEFINRIGDFATSPIVCMFSGNLLIYQYNVDLVDTSLNVGQAVQQRENTEAIAARDTSMARIAMGQRRISPKKTARSGTTIYFVIACENGQSFDVSWRP